MIERMVDDFLRNNFNRGKVLRIIGINDRRQDEKSERRLSNGVSGDRMHYLSNVRKSITSLTKARKWVVRGIREIETFPK